MSRNSSILTGVLAIALSVFLLLIGIPYGVTSPGDVQNIVLSPLFWPRVLSVLLGVTGVGLLLSSRYADPNSSHTDSGPSVPGGFVRLASLGVLFIIYVWSIDKIGMVWASMIAFVALALLIKTHHLIPALIAAVALPLLLYGFFAHVAGVSIPQGEFVRLP